MIGTEFFDGNKTIFILEEKLQGEVFDGNSSTVDLTQSKRSNSDRRSFAEFFAVDMIVLRRSKKGKPDCLEQRKNPICESVSTRYDRCSGIQKEISHIGTYIVVRVCVCCI